MELSIQVKTYMVFGLIFACFAILYPKIFHPMILSLLGRRRQEDQMMADSMLHPRERSPLAKGPTESPQPPPFARPHPGMNQGARQTAPSSGNNMMTVILPIYAVGVVIYLLYTLVRVLTGKGKPGARKHIFDKMQEQHGSVHLDARTGEFTNKQTPAKDYFSSPNKVETAETLTSPETMQNLSSSLSKLAERIEQKTISEDEKSELRVRLEQTERQMAQILEAMQAIHSKVEQNEEVAEEDLPDGLCKRKGFEAELD